MGAPMRKTFLLALGLTALSTAGMVSANAADKTYWDQATGKWMKYDTKAGKAAPVRGNTTATTQMGKPQQTYRNSNPVPRQTVDYTGPFKPNTIVVNTAERRLYYIQPNGKALKYGIGVGREGFTWSGVNTITRKAEWPGWTPPPEMIAREKKKGKILPAFMEGGPNNPLGARAMYIGDTLYRIHGTSEPWTIGTAVSSGCIRLTNDDVSHLYEKVRVGARVVVLRGDESNARLVALANPPPPKKEILVAEARSKDDALESLGIGVAVAGLVPADAIAPSNETTASVTPAEAPAATETASVPEAVAKDDEIAAVPAAEAVAEEPAIAEASAPAVDEAAKDDQIAAAPASDVGADTPTVDEAPALAVDEAAKDDTHAVAAVVNTPAIEPVTDEVVADESTTVAATPELGDAVAAPVTDAPDVTPAADKTAVEPVTKDDGIATDLGGKAIPIDSKPSIGDDTASNTAAAPVTVAN